MHFLRLEPLHDKGLFLRTIERPIKSRDPAGIKRVQVRRASASTKRPGWAASGRPAAV